MLTHLVNKQSCVVFLVICWEEATSINYWERTVETVNYK